MTIALMVAVLLSMLGTLLIGARAKWLGENLGLMDYPNKAGGRKRHRQATPLVGGIGFFWACWAGTVALVLCGTADRDIVWPDTILGAALVASAAAAIGVVDDRFELSARFRLLLSAIILVAALTLLPDLQLTSLRFSGQTGAFVLPGFSGLLFSILCLIGFQNSINMADGKNGYVIGQALVWTLILALRAPPSFLLLFAPLGAGLLVLMWFNLKGRLFLGDGGSYCLSTFYGLVAIAIWNMEQSGLRSDDLALVFALPVFDTLRLIVTRVLKRKTPFTAGRDHLHHYLAMHWGWPKPLLGVLLVVLLPNLGAILFPGTAALWLVVTFVAYTGLLFLSSRRPRR